MMENKRFTNKRFKFCPVCRSKQKLVIIEKEQHKLGVYNCPKCNADRVDSYVLVHYYESGCRIVGKGMNAYTKFNSL